MEGTGGKARIYRHFRKITISRFFAFSEHVATTQPTWETDFKPKKVQKRGYSLIENLKTWGAFQDCLAFLANAIGE